MSATQKDTRFKTIKHFFLLNFSVLPKAIALWSWIAEIRLPENQHGDWTCALRGRVPHHQILRGIIND
jgi:hypothetical protein